MKFICNVRICYEPFLGSMMYGGNIETNFLERASSEHISDQVNLKWSLLNTEINGIALLKGITLSSAMLGLITVAPLQWRKNLFRLIRLLISRLI